MPSLPRDDNRVPIQGMGFSSVALAVTYDATISASTEITLNVATKAISVTAIDKPIFMKWGTADATSSAFDYLIPANSTATFSVPSGTTAVNFLEQAATAVLSVSEF